MLDFFASPEFLIGLLSLLFTVLILSYVVGDNPAFRLAVHVFIGISAGYVAAIVLLQVIANKLIVPLVFGDIYQQVLVVIPLILGLMLFTKLSPRIEWIGRPVVAFLVGTGAAAVVAGAIMGTIYPQVASSVNELNPNRGLLDLLGGVFILLGTVATLAYFQFTVIGQKTSGGAQGLVIKVITFVGQIFIAITLGTLFAGVFSAALTALIDRIQSIVLFIELILQKLLH